MFRGFYYVIVMKLKIGKVDCKNLVNLDVIKKIKIRCFEF